MAWINWRTQSSGVQLWVTVFPPLDNTQARALQEILQTEVDARQQALARQPSESSQTGSEGDGPARRNDWTLCGKMAGLLPFGEDEEIIEPSDD